MNKILILLGVAAGSVLMYKLFFRQSRQVHATGLLIPPTCPAGQEWGMDIKSCRPLCPSGYARLHDANGSHCVSLAELMKMEANPRQRVPECPFGQIWTGTRCVVGINF